MPQQNIEYAFLGGIFPENLLDEVTLKSKGNIQNAANVLQWNIINGIDQNIKRPIKLFNQMFVGSYPQKYSDYRIKTFSFSHKENSMDINMGFVNLFFLKQLLLPIVPKKHLIKWVNSEKDKKKVLIVYSSNFLESIVFIKNIDPSVHVCLILPDLPCYMNLHRQNNLLYKIKNFTEQKKLLKSVKYIDSFVLLTEKMKDVIRVDSSKSTIVIEGMISKTLVETNQYKENNIKTICYTGTLTKKYGIMDLVDAFLLLNNDDYRLVICGSGEAEQDIKRAAARDSRIRYKGIISHADVVNVQQQATILVNPRKNDEEYTKYSFPSKIMEYMKAGKPIVCYKLDGIPNEYDGFLNYVADDSIESLKNKLDEILSLSEEKRQTQGINNQSFVLKNKNNSVQTSKILNMINNHVC